MVPAKLRVKAEEKGLTIEDKGNGHLQLVGGSMLVNYYPHSKQKSCYVAGTKKAVYGCDYDQAITLCFVAPAIAKEKDKRKGNSRLKRSKMLRKQRVCHWCPTRLNINNSTVEHVIPLARGGLDNANNRVLACSPCNEKRGSDMPELKQ